MSTQSVLEYASRKLGGVPRLPPVVGGSRRRYWTIADALAGESALLVELTGVVPQAGTVAGVLVGPGTLPATDGALKDHFVVNTDTTPSNGLVNQWARVSNYVGASRTMTLDKPWDFAAESDVAIIQPIRIALEEDVTEDVTVTAACALDLQGHRLQGKIDVTGGVFCWIQGGSGYITNGVQKTNAGVLRADDCTISRRDATIYALLLTEGSDLGRCEIANCAINGCVAGRRGYSGWNVQDCKIAGVVSVSGYDNVPVRCVESVTGVPIIFFAADVVLNGPFGGTVLYSENSLTGSGFLSVGGSISGVSSSVSQDPNPNVFYVMAAIGAGVCSPTISSGLIRVSGNGIGNAGSNTKQRAIRSILGVIDFTGTAAPVINVTASIYGDGPSIYAVVHVNGTVDMTGTVSLTGSGAVSLGQVPAVASNSVLVLDSRVTTGSVTVGLASTISMSGSNDRIFTFQVPQDAGAPSITVSCAINNLMSGPFMTVAFFAAAATPVSVGTYVISGNLVLQYSTGTGLVNLSAVVTGGVWTISSANITATMGFGAANISIFSHGGSGGALTVSGTVRIVAATTNALNRFRLIDVTVSGASITVSGAVLLSGMVIGSTASTMVNTVAGGTAALTSTFEMMYCSFSGNLTLLNAPAGGTGTGPTSVILNYCKFDGTLTTQSGAGGITWTGATIRFQHSDVVGLYTVVLTAFATHEAFHSSFLGNSSNLCISASGTRPTTYRYWYCSFPAASLNLTPAAALTPEIIWDATPYPANAALTRGNLMDVNATPRAIAAVAGSVVKGVLLAAAAAAANPAILVRRGRIFVSANAAVVAAADCVLDAATPTQMVAGAAVIGQTIGQALEAVGTTIAGLAYTEVAVR